MPALERIDDALERHCALRASLDFARPAAPVAEALASYDALPRGAPASLTEALRAYTREVDAPAHEGQHARNEAALAACSDEALGLLPDAIERWMGLSLALPGPAPFRTQPAYAHGGLHHYALPDGGIAPLFAACRARWSRLREDRAHPLVYGALAYFDAMYLHPFDDGNARLARALFVSLLRDARGAAPDLRALVWLPKTPGDERSFWRFVTVAARSARPRAHHP